ncbi:MAG: thymidylate synthase [Patescibacteria group bacterium]|jgi:thymidylate synthase|nr:thymidylate synthase [Patescibacteria group bacterium]
MTLPEMQYHELLRTIVNSGQWQETRQGPRTRVALGLTMRFDLQREFPMITDRDISGFWRGAIGELCAMINGARTLEQFEAFGCTWWGPWATEKKCAKRGLEPGDIGPASYGDVFANYPGPDGAPFHQWLAIVDQIKREPALKTHVITNWLAGHLTRAYGHQPTPTIAPCHGHVQITVLGDRLNLEMFQRSGDVPVGVPSNMVQYAAITHALAYLTGYTPGTFVHHIGNAHFYEDQTEAVETILARKPRPLPKLVTNFEGVDVITDVRPTHFAIEDYNPHERILSIPVAV